MDFGGAFMGIKEELLKLRDKLLQPFSNNRDDQKNNLISRQHYYYDFAPLVEPIVLDDEVDKFIKWYCDNMVSEEDEYTKFRESNELRNFIEKMAVWYELRYPDYEINRLMPGSNQEDISVNDVMFKNNHYINDILDEDTEVKELDWDEFYNTKSFINSLPMKEKRILLKPKYCDIVFIDKRRLGHLHLTSNGFVKEADGIDLLEDNETITDGELKGKHVTEVVKVLKENGVQFDKDNEVEKAITDYENRAFLKDNFLNCVMYRIIERGGNRFGPRRGFLFAREFGRNINVPMVYGVDRSDPGIENFVGEFLRVGGSEDLTCYCGYFKRNDKYEKLYTISLNEFFADSQDRRIKKYTPEETYLYQRLVDDLMSQTVQDTVRKEEVKRLRLERKLEKSRKDTKTV